jgi:hypothetical protein
MSHPFIKVPADYMESQTLVSRGVNPRRGAAPNIAGVIKGVAQGERGSRLHLLCDRQGKSGKGSRRKALKGLGDPWAEEFLRREQTGIIA